MKRKWQPMWFASTYAPSPLCVCVFISLDSFNFSCFSSPLFEIVIPKYKMRKSDGTGDSSRPTTIITYWFYPSNSKANKGWHGPLPGRPRKLQLWGKGQSDHRSRMWCSNRAGGRTSLASYFYLAQALAGRRRQTGIGRTNEERVNKIHFINRSNCYFAVANYRVFLYSINASITRVRSSKAAQPRKDQFIYRKNCRFLAELHRSL